MATTGPAQRPEPTGQGLGSPVISAAQAARWQAQGLLFLDGLWPAELLQQAKAQAAAAFPPPSAGAEGATRAAKARFPMDKEALPALNLTSLEPRLLAAAAALLHGAEHDLRLVRSDLVSTAGEAARLQPDKRARHLVPQPAAAPDAVEMVLFLEDATYAPGSALALRTDLGYIGEPVPHGTRRLAQHLIFRKAAAEYVQSDAFIRSLSGHGELMGALAPAQRSCLGFPPPGHAFWQDPSCLALAIERYPAFDPAPYIEHGAPADFMAQWAAGVGRPVPHDNDVVVGGGTAVAARVFDKAYGYEGVRLASPERAAGPDLLVDSGGGEGGGLVLSDEQVQRWRELGYLFLTGIWPRHVMDAAVEAARALAPDPLPDGTVA